jgi:uncharacterized membrane protein YfcA
MLIIIALGVFVGLVMGLTGAGGGILAVPLLVFFLHLPLTAATPIGLLAVATAASIGALASLRHRVVRYRAALLMSLAGIMFSPIGIWLAHRINNHYLVIIFSIILLYVAYASFRDQSLKTLDGPTLPTCNINDQSGRFIWTTRCSISMMLTGAIAGFLSGLIGVGGGFVIVPALQRLSGLSIQSVVATSLAVTAILSSSVVAGNIAIGNLNWLIAIPFSLGAISGMLLGTLVTGKVDAKTLKKAFAVSALIVSLLMLSKAFT